MKAKILLLLTVTTLSLTAGAQDNIKKAKTILDKLGKTYNGYKNIKTGFTILTVSPDKSRKTEAGTIWIQKKSFKIETSGLEITCDATKMCTHHTDVKEAVIQKYNPSKDEIQPSQLFTLWEKGYDYVWVEKVTEGGVSLDVIDLVPSEGKESKDYSKVKLKINTSQNKLISADIIKKDGTVVTYTLKNQETNLKLDKDFFKIDAAAMRKKGIDVIEL